MTYKLDVKSLLCCKFEFWMLLNHDHRLGVHMQKDYWALVEFDCAMNKGAVPA